MLPAVSTPRKNTGIKEIGGWQTAKIVAGVKKLLSLGPPKLLVTVSLDGAGKQHDEIRRRKDAA